MASAFQWLNRGRDALAPEDYAKIERGASERGHNEPKVRALGRRAAPWLACWVVTCCLALNGCASKTPQAANEPSSYPPWVCGLSHNKDRWQCQREGEEPSAGEREEEPLAGEELSAGEREGEPLADGQPAPSAAPSAEARKPTPAKTPPPDPASGPATAEAQPEPPSPPTEPAPNEDNDAPVAAADDPPEPANQTSPPAEQVSSPATSQLPESAGWADEKSNLMALPPDYFAIQAGAFPNPEALQEHITQYGIEPAYRVRLASNNRLFHVLILQTHDSQRAAEAALANLPQPLNGMDLWIRPVGSLQDAVRAGDALAND